MAKNKYYTKTEIEDGKYIEISVTEKVQCEIEITSPCVSVKIIATGGNGNIKFIYGNEEFVCPVPFWKGGADIVRDWRDTNSIYAINNPGSTPTKVIDMKNVSFIDKTPDEIVNLHSLFINREDKSLYWLAV
jgi:hypothetical protein